MSTPPPLQNRVLRLERALAAAVLQERYTDAASLRDALDEARRKDPLLRLRAQLNAAVAAEDFTSAARLRDELAETTERLSTMGGRRVDRIVVLKGRGDPENALRVATVSRDGDVMLGLVPEERRNGRRINPRVYLQPTWSPSGDFVAMTEISFDLDPAKLGRGVAIAESASRVVIMNTFDGSVVKSAPINKPPFFYFWSPDGKSVALLANDTTSGATTVALSVLQVVAARGGSGLDLDSITGPLADGHPFLFDFCPRDSSKIVAHMGDKSTVGVVDVKRDSRGVVNLTEKAGNFGAPQWHPKAGKEGREVVLFVENDVKGITIAEDLLVGDGEVKIINGGDASILELQNRNGIEVEGIVVTVEVETGDDEPEDNDQTLGLDGNTADSPSKDDDDFNIENFLSSGTTLLENVFRKGAESLGLGSRDDLNDGDQDEKGQVSGQENGKNGEQDKAGASTFQDRLSRFLRKPVTVELSKKPEQPTDDISSVNELPTNRLVMCDVNKPEKRREISRASGVMAFKLSPDGEALAVLVTNPITGQDELVVSTGNFSPDTVDQVDDDGHLRGGKGKRQKESAADVILSNPKTRVLAFFWSPDATKLLFLTSLRESKVDAAQWATFDRETNKVVRYEKFILSGIYTHCLNFFDQFGASMTPWSPDSDAFCYPGRPLTQAEQELEQRQGPAPAPSLSELLMQKDAFGDGKRFSARVQYVPTKHDGSLDPEPAKVIVDNVEYTCWSPC